MSLSGVTLIGSLTRAPLVVWLVSTSSFSFIPLRKLLMPLAMSLIIDGYNLLHVTGVTGAKGDLQGSREALLRRFVDIQYDRSEDLRRGTFRVRGDMIEIYPTYEDNGYRIEMWGEQIDALRQIDPLTGEVRAGQEDLNRVPIYPKTHYVMPTEQRERAIVTIYEELEW